MTKAVYLIVGADGGVGRRVAIELLAKGHRIVCGCHRDTVRDSLPPALTSSEHVEIVGYDLASALECERLVKVAKSRFGRLNGVLCYAGVTWASPLDACSIEHIRDVINTNVVSTLVICREAIRAMRSSGGGSIVFIGSPHADIGESDRAVYACSKAVLPTLARHISRHYAAVNIRANVVVMGWTPTPGELILRAEAGVGELALRQFAAAKLPSRRMTEEEDFVPTIIHLLSPESAMLAGSVVRVTGGWFI